MKPGNEIKMRIVLQAPPTGVLFGLQKGKGNDYETVQKQKFVDQDLLFEFPATLKVDNGQVDFAGPFVQGPRDGRFIYVDIGNSYHKNYRHYKFYYENDINDSKRLGFF